MQYNGFRSIREYENECARLGFTTRRIGFHREDGEACFVLVTAPPNPPTGTSVEAWSLFPADESRLLLGGIISGGMMDPAKYMRNGLDVNYLGKLAAHGYFPDEAPPSPAPPSAALTRDQDGQLCFLF